MFSRQLLINNPFQDHDEKGRCRKGEFLDRMNKRIKYNSPAGPINYTFTEIELTNQQLNFINIINIDGKILASRITSCNIYIYIFFNCIVGYTSIISCTMDHEFRILCNDTKANLSRS